MARTQGMVAAGRGGTETHADTGIRVSLNSHPASTRNPIHGAIAAFLAVLAACLVAPAIAAAAWGPPIDLSVDGQDATSDGTTPQVAVDPDGDAVFAWTHPDDWRIKTRARSAEGALSGAQAISAAGQIATEPQVAVDADGNAVFAWTRADGANSRIYARARTAAGTLSAVQTLSAAGQDAFDPQVAVDADGDAVFAWVRSDGANRRIQARARSADGALSGVQTVSAAGQDAFEPEVAVTPDGDAVFSWERSDGSNWRIQTRGRTAAGALSGVQTLSAAGLHGSDGHVAVDADGNAVFAWERSDRLQTRARSATGELSAVQNISAAGQGAEEPEVDVDADGNAVFAWVRGDDRRVQTRARSSEGTLSGIQTISAAGEGTWATEPQVAVDADGDAVLAWQRFDGTNSRIQARARSAEGILSSIRTISPAGRSARQPQIALDADSDAVATWKLSDGANSRIQAASWTPPAPEFGFLASWGTPGPANGQFNIPTGIATDAARNVYVADAGNRRIQKFSPAGAHLLNIGACPRGVGDCSPDGWLDNPVDVAVDAAGNVYVADRDNHRIQKFSASGQFLAKWGTNGTGNGQFSHPQGIAIDSAGLVYVADSGNDRIQRFTASGEFRTKWGTTGLDPGQFRYPSDIAIDVNRNIYVTDEGNDRIQKFTQTRTFLGEWGSAGSGDGEFYNPRGIAVDAAGDVYVSDRFNERVQKFTSSGGFLSKFGGSGAGDGLFADPASVATDCRGNVYVADRNNHRVQKFGFLGAPRPPWPPCE
jgi:tripartite motif-containing protein 71